MTTKKDALHSLRPGAQWVLRGDDLEWHDQAQSKPTDAEIDAEVARLTALEPARIAAENRKVAYQIESDPLFFKWQAGEATEAEWKAKDAEFKADLSAIGQQMMMTCNEANAKSIRTDYGTVMRRLNERYTVADGDS